MALKQIKILKYFFFLLLHTYTITCEGEISLDNQQVHSSTDSSPTTSGNNNNYNYNKSNNNNNNISATVTESTTSISLESTTISISSNGERSKSEENNLYHERLIQNTPSIYCTCDLHPFICDINCCCDSKCTQDERQIFSHCTPTGDATFTNTPKSCYSKHLFAYSSHLTNPNEKESSSVRSTLFCVEWSNSRKKNYYPNRKSITSSNEVAKINTGQKYTWKDLDESLQITESIDESQIHLRDGDALRLINPNLPGWQIWTLPSSIFSPQGNGLCDSNQPTRYLRSSITSCLRYIRSLQTDCSSFLSQSTFTDHLIDRKVPAFINSPYTSSGFVDSLKVQVETSQATTSSSSKNAIKNKGNTLTASLYSSSSCIKDGTCIPFTASKDDISSPTTFVLVNDTKQPNSKPKATCVNAIRKVMYQILYKTNVKSGPIIEKINVMFDRLNVTGSKGYFRQYFDVSFIKLPSNESNETSTAVEVDSTKYKFKFSGNPGYQMNMPILAIKIVESIKDETNETNSSITSLTGSEATLMYGNLLLPMLSGNIDNSCPSSTNSLFGKNLIVKFGLNSKTSCLLNLSSVRNKSSFTQLKVPSYFTFLPSISLRDEESAICHRIQGTILESLDMSGKILNVTHIGIFGNSNLSHPSDWLPIINVNPSPFSSSLEPLAIEIPHLTPNGICPLLVTGLSYEIYYSMVGPVEQPQAKIISFVRKFITTNNVQPFVSNSKSFTSFITISSTVTFYDLTRGMRSKFAPPPVLKIQLPADFFYPFLLMHSSSSSSSSSLECNSIYLTVKIITLGYLVIFIKCNLNISIL